MSVVVAIFALMLAVGCSNPVSSGSTGSASRQSPSAPLSASASPDLPLSRMGFTCRLPVASYFYSGADTYTTGFIAFPGALFRQDATASFHASGTGGWETAATPTLYGVPNGTPVYDWPMHRWIPADEAETAPDGSSYAYSTAGDIGSGKSFIHVVHVADASERIYTVAAPAAPWMGGSQVPVHIASVDGSSVYFSYPEMEAYPREIWRLDPSDNAVSSLSKTPGVMAIHSGYAWVGRSDPRDPFPPSFARGGEFFDSVVRIDLSTGSETPWYYWQGHVVVVRGFDETGSPVVGPDTTLNIAPETFRLVPSPGDSGTVIFAGYRLDLTGPLADGPRLWFGSYRGIYLWTPGAELRKVFAPSSSPSNAILFPGGPCR